MVYWLCFTNAVYGYQYTYFDTIPTHGRKRKGMTTSLRHNGKEYRKGAPFRVGMILKMYVERSIRTLNAERVAELVTRF